MNYVHFRLISFSPSSSLLLSTPLIKARTTVSSLQSRFRTKSTSRSPATQVVSYLSFDLVLSPFSDVFVFPQSLRERMPVTFLSRLFPSRTLRPPSRVSMVLVERQRFPTVRLSSFSSLSRLYSLIFWFHSAYRHWWRIWRSLRTRRRRRLPSVSRLLSERAIETDLCLFPQYHALGSYPRESCSPHPSHQPRILPSHLHGNLCRTSLHQSARSLRG